MSVFDKIKNGLEEAIAYERGELSANTTKLSVRPVSKYDATEIKRIRSTTGLSQLLFAEFMGVSVKTVEAWESGRNHPIGTACRLLELIDDNPLFPRASGIICDRNS